MFDEFLLAVNAWMTGGSAAAYAGAFLWGLVSVLFSPCHLASIPLMVGYVAGQGRLVQGREAVRYALAFTSGLFASIALVGAACALLGRMLGDIGPYWTIGVGLVLVYVALDMLGLAACRMPGSLMSRLTLRGLPGALVMGLAYGLLSGSCTFGFLAPLLAVITVQEQVLTGLGLVLTFALGHCLPIVVAGSSAALARRMMEGFSGGGTLVRRAAGTLVGLLGLYFIARPFLET
ncbi:cytochrome c-type biogenesis protein [Humidesulfovibrio mexicanus]|uniref:Cytochrome c-type biogenesis protein n=1 Tax=Humidesulfovibrio mexicanus TaxID=147047 RepID=A0A239ARN7_9BACT|nr:cytochrome c biogenesis protein CcdA [Humidesulfovibrio mexicanus]SNR98287.1 cytochrome c-type biogenesis protein [Humidesulfovibrio mexicanus]